MKCLVLIICVILCRLQEGSPTTTDAICADGEFTCADNVTCIPYNDRCDNFNDCGDNSDELDNCNIPCDSEYEFECATAGCIDASWRCDGAEDCFDGSDEISCATTETPATISGGDTGRPEREDEIPSKPFSFDAVPAGDTALSVSWSPPLGQVAIRGYKIGYGASDPGETEIETDKNTYTLTISDLEPNESYILRLFAFNNFGDGLPVYYFHKTGSLDGDGSTGQLTPPIILDTVVQPDGSSIEVSWTGIDGATDGRYYMLRYRPKPPSRWTSINSTETSYLVDNLEPDTLYTFDVKVVRGEDESIPSLETHARTSEEFFTNVTQPQPDASIPEGCEAVEVPLCKPVPYNYTVLPNLLGHTTQSEISVEVNKWLPILASGCSELVGFFVCSLYVPVCTPQFDRAISPCRSVCETIKEDCQAAVDATEGFDWPEELQCQYFPTLNNTDGEICFSPDSLPPGLTPPGPDPECYTNATGVDYRGVLSVTTNGKECQKWTSQSPHSHYRTPDNYPDYGLGDHNYCRNPDGVSGPWCYTTDSESRWEYCDVAEPQASCGGPPDGEGPFGPDGPPSQCEVITDVALCDPTENHIPWNYTILPNLLGQELQTDVDYASMMFNDLIMSECSPLLRFFVCTVYTPVCSILLLPLPPCRELCELPRSQCQAEMESQGFEWPSELACENFPPEGLCVGITGPPGPEDIGPGGPDGPDRETEGLRCTICYWSSTNGEEDDLPFITDKQTCYNDYASADILSCNDAGEPEEGQVYRCHVSNWTRTDANGDFRNGISRGCIAVNQEQFGSILETTNINDTQSIFNFRLGEGDVQTGLSAFCDTDGCVPGEEDTSEGEKPERPDIQEGTATCEPLSDAAKEICPGIEYTETIFPNSLGHRDQNEAVEMLNTQAELMGLDCPIGLFLCVLALPPCKTFGENGESAVPLLPCREECAYVETSCVDVDFSSIFEGANKWRGDLDCSSFSEVYSFPPLCWEINNDFLEEAKPDSGDTDNGDIIDGQCTDDVPDMCRDLGFKATSYPNVFNHADALDVAKAFEELQPLIDSGCSEDISSFLCAAHVPVCDANGTAILPCHETCRQVWKPCKDTAAQMGIDRPKAFGCSKNYPSSKEGAVCLDSFTPPTNQPIFKQIQRMSNDATLMLSADDAEAKYFQVEVFGPSDVSKLKVDVAGDPTLVTVPDLDPASQYFVNINTANEFGQSESNSDIIEKFEGVRCMNLEIEMCQGLGYESGLADGSPNVMGHVDQAEALYHLEQFKPLIDVGCSPDIQRLLCWFFAPGCSPDMKTVEPPCRDTCENARFGCEFLMKAFGYDWPEILQCDQFPYKNDTERTCEGGDLISNYETANSGGTEYQCTKLFETGPQPLWLDPEGNEIGEDPESPIFSTVINSRTTRLTIGENAPGDYTCVSGEFETEATVDVQGKCHLSRDHPVCKQHFDSFFLPNIFNHTSREDAMLSVNSFIPLLATNCSEYLSQFACYLYLPNKGCPSGSSANATQEPEEGYGRTITPCRELCLKVQYDCAEQINDIGYLWPEQASCDNLPPTSDNQCDGFGISELDLEYTTDPTISPDENATDFEMVTGFTDFPENYTELVTEFPDNYTEFVTLEPEYVTEITNITEDTNETLGGELCAGLKPRRYDIEDYGSDCLFRGWADVQGQGAANDYCRIVSNGGPQFLSCALAGSSDDHVYTSPNASVDWFDAGHTDTWYMRDEDLDGRDDYCRCVGIPPDTTVRCLKAGDSGFMGDEDFDMEESSDCQYNKVNPFFGAP